jgi:small subunit ribosomal protein S2
MEEVSLKALLEAGCHFGHKADRWHPKAARFIYQERDGIHVIDLAKTKAGLEAAGAYVKQLAAEGKKVLFVGTKRQAGPIVRAEAEAAGAPFIAQRWIGGFLTNWPEVHKNLEKIRRLTEEEKTGAWNKFPKHERVKLGRYLKKLHYLYGGVVQLTSPPDAFFVVDIKKEKVAVSEARKMEVPVVGMVDTNSDPEWTDYVIPSNDDAVGAVQLIVHYMAQAYKEGLDVHHKEIEAASAVKPEEKKDVAVEKPLSGAVKPDAKPEAKVEVKPTAVPEKAATPSKNPKRKAKSKKTETEKTQGE